MKHLLSCQQFFKHLASVQQNPLQMAEVAFWEKGH
jgi:hypothetical protein